MIPARGLRSSVAEESMGGQVMRRVSRFVLLVVAGFGGLSSRSYAGELTFSERLAAETALAKVYYAHQDGNTQPFDAAVPRATVERKVRRTVQESLLLEQRWGRPITS